MSEQIFASVYVDECISPLLAEYVRKEGWLATSAAEEKVIGLSDVEQLDEANKRKSVLVTCDKGTFLAEIKGVSHNGVIIVPRSVPLQAINKLGKKICLFLNQYTSDEFKDLVLFVQF